MKRILLIDDEAHEHMYVGFLLKDRYGDDFVLSHAKTIADAQAHLRANRVDVILLDDRLGGGLTAVDTIPQLRQCAFNVPVVVVSKNTDSRHLRDIARMRTNTVVDKFQFRHALAAGLLERFGLADAG